MLVNVVLLPSQPTMAGRGTDIKLGEGVRELGGLCVIGTRNVMKAVVSITSFVDVQVVKETQVSH